MKMKMKMKTAACLLVGLLAGVEAANAGVIIGAQSVDVSVPSLSSRYLPLEELINQEGLSANYVSGVSDFNSFVTTTTHADPTLLNGGGWASATSSVYPANIDFDLGEVFDVTSLALWNDTDTQALGQFNVFASLDSSFSALTWLGSFFGSIAVANTSVAEVFDINDVATQYLRVAGSPVLNTNGVLNIGEIAFEAKAVPVPVPVPSSIALIALGLLGLAGIGFSCNKNKV